MPTFHSLFYFLPFTPFLPSFCPFVFLGAFVLARLLREVTVRTVFCIVRPGTFFPAPSPSLHLLSPLFKSRMEGTEGRKELEDGTGGKDGSKGTEGRKPSRNGRTDASHPATTITPTTTTLTPTPTPISGRN
jgi:hypothetical protein